MASVVIMVFINRPVVVFLALVCSLGMLMHPSAVLADTPPKSPHGIFVMDDPFHAWTNAAVDGLRLQVRWTDIQPSSETEFDWSIIDTQLARAQATQKQLGIALMLLSAPPAWLTSISGVKTYQLTGKSGETVSIVLPWDPIVQSKLINFITQLCLRYDGLLDYIVVGGIGCYSAETYFPFPEDIGLDMSVEDEIAAWTASSIVMIDTYGANLKSTPFVMALSIPFNYGDGAAAINELVDHGLLYGRNFGLMNWGLTARSSGNSTFLPWVLISQYSPTNPAGFQLLCPAAGRGDQTLGGTLGETLDSGIALGAQWIEVYPTDANNPDYAAVLEDASARMNPPPPPPPTYTYTYTYTDTDTDSYSDTHPYRDPDAYANAYAYRHSNAHSPTYTDAYTSGTPTPTPPPTPTPTPSGTPTPTPPPTPTPTPSGTPTPTPTATPTPTPTPAYFLNVSTRVKVLTSDQVMIGGFIITGAGSKSVVIRALGPSLAQNGTKRTLPDPVLEVYDSSGSLIAENDNWISPLPPDVVASGLTPGDPAESLIATTLAPGHYTAVLRGANGCTGVALCELYDTGSSGSKVRNISTRGMVGTDDEVMIAGFILGGSTNGKVLIRALGPSLAEGGVIGFLADPMLELHDAQGALIDSNDNWRTTQRQQILASGLPPANSKEAAIVATLEPGNYTAIVRGANSKTGVALVEVYALDGP